MTELPVEVTPNDPAYTAAPPPWTLRGRGFVALYRKPSDAVLERWVPGALRASYVGGPAAIMLVDYAESGAGPYQELLFVPGRFSVAGGVFPVITRIVVSTWESVANGRLNWAIPKEVADFRVAREGRQEQWRVEQDGELLADLRFRALGVRMPVTTALLPAAWATVAQPRGNEFLLTRLSAVGRCRLAGRVEARFGAERFPDLGERRPRLAVVTDPFRMIFPVPVVRST